MKEITLTIDREGNTVIATKGFTGTECLKETMALEAALGTTTSDVKTREASTSTTATNRQTTGDRPMTIIIRPNGDLRFIYADALVDLLNEGEARITRASHVEPHADGGWAADMAPSGGPVLLDNGHGFRTRQAALDAEVAWLQTNRGL